MVCAEQLEDGSWANVDLNTRSLTRADLRFICQDQVLNGQQYPPGPPWYVHLWGGALQVTATGERSAPNW